MKKIRYYIGILVLVGAGAIYIADTYLGIDLVGMFVPDSTPPVIDVEDIKTQVQLDGTIDLTLATCKDNRDDSCTVEVTDTVDTSIVGDYNITFKSTDEAGNFSTELVTVSVYEGLNTAIYVPNGYYDSISGLTGEALKNALNDIITGHSEFPYTDTTTDVWDLLRDADEDPDNSDNVVLFYSEFTWPKECQDTRTDLLPDYCFVDSDRDNDYTEWNREHIWSKSHGDFEEEDEYEFKLHDGGYALGAHTDAHHLVPAERTMNSVKNNRFFDDCHDGVDDDNLEDRGYGNFTCGDWYFEPRDEVKGDVARMLFYMATRYEGEDGDYVDLELTTDLYLYEDLATAIKNSKLPYYENLEVLLRWHMEDPVDEWEIERNESIYQNQGNRNPFIDHPDLVELIWGTPENPTEYVSTTQAE